ncbi:MAG: hypothetical protein OQK82_00095, partial [Candidatus Pacearchaeota archaeon]|nr:hypothetical protein [Candidatus Pacearchaeota archaeon]
MRMREVFILFVVLANLSFLSCDVDTEVSVANSPPFLETTIPNFSISMGGNLINAFDLDNYFSDDNGDELFYWASSIENVSVVIDENNFVSFFPEPDLFMTREVVFYASDGYVETSSNIVTLFIGSDIEPPRWSSCYKNAETIYQNNFVNFSCIWTDNVQLDGYVFSINQGGWSNYSGSFSGVFNRSETKVQISAGGGSIVSWFFCANDTSSNINCTDIHEFEVKSFPSNEGDSSDSSSSGESSKSSSSTRDGSITSRVSDNQLTTITNFSLSESSFNVVLKQGSRTTKILKITNVGTSVLDFSLNISGLEEYVTLSEYDFSLLAGESKT